MTNTSGLVVDKPSSANFFSSRWRGEVPLGTLFWRDILIFGSVINLFGGFFALMIAAQGGAVWGAALVHFASLPYNVFLVLALWRTPGRSKAMAWTSLLWLGTVTVI